MHQHAHSRTCYRTPILTPSRLSSATRKEWAFSLNFWCMNPALVSGMWLPSVWNSLSFPPPPPSLSLSPSLLHFPLPFSVLPPSLSFLPPSLLSFLYSYLPLVRAFLTVFRPPYILATDVQSFSHSCIRPLSLFARKLRLALRVFQVTLYLNRFLLPLFLFFQLM